MLSVNNNSKLSFAGYRFYGLKDGVEVVASRAKKQVYESRCSAPPRDLLDKTSNIIMVEETIDKNGAMEIFNRLGLGEELESIAGAVRHIYRKVLV